ncbi:hypothetical protein [Sphingobacterium anhuiense]|uniref:hypothetical protein n=1 Tax=Sphingobacterium anhuiense TaxID=493780 RepID=UPI003C2CF605
MNKKEFNEYDLVINNLENLRLSLKIEMQEIDEYADLGINTYSRIISRKQPIRLDELISIANNIYNLKGTQILSSNLKIPSPIRLPSSIKTIVTRRKDKTPRAQEKRDIIQFCILVLNRYFKVEDSFSNSEIKGHFNEELKKAFKNKSIEWNKSILSSFVTDTGETKKAKTKSEKIYKLIEEIPDDLVRKAEEKVGTSWLHK